jgi:hypothetical protein
VSGPRFPPRLAECFFFAATLHLLITPDSSHPGRVAFPEITTALVPECSPGGSPLPAGRKGLQTKVDSKGAWGRGHTAPNPSGTPHSHTWSSKLSWRKRHQSCDLNSADPLKRAGQPHQFLKRPVNLTQISAWVGTESERLGVYHSQAGWQTRHSKPDVQTYSYLSYSGSATEPIVSVSGFKI